MDLEIGLVFLILLAAFVLGRIVDYFMKRPATRKEKAGEEVKSGNLMLRSASGPVVFLIFAGALDTAKNFFGSIMILIDKPFGVGQRIVVEGFDGTVEEMGFSSSRVRTLTGHLVTAPNDRMITNNAENIGR